MGECDLKIAGRRIGRASWRATGPDWQFRAHCPAEQGFVYRVLLETAEGGQVLGVMAPEGDFFALEKKLPLSLTRRLGPELEGIRGAAVIRSRPGEYQGETGLLPFPLEAFEPWTAETAPPCPLLAEALEGEGALVRRWGPDYYIAAPLEPGRPFGLACVFCLALPMQIGQRQYGVVRLNEKGNFFFVNTEAQNGADYL